MIAHSRVARPISGKAQKLAFRESTVDTETVDGPQGDWLQ